MASKLFNVFVYGTLKRGEPNHYWLTRSENGYARFLTEGLTEEKFPLVVGTRYNIPFLLDKRGRGNNVQGEVYEVDQTMMANLDVLEDYPKYYDRELQMVATKNHGVMQCWLYLIRSFPEQLLNKTHLKSYHNSLDQPYCESYLDSTKDDMYDEIEKQPDQQTLA